MPRTLPPLASRFGDYVDKMMGVCEAVEITLASDEPRGVARTQLTPSRVVHLYEAAYLRMFSAWENFLEECCIRYMLDYQSPQYSPVVCVDGLSTLKEARTHVYGGRDYVLWHNPNAVVARVSSRLENSPIETVVNSSYQALEWMAFVRHRVAHDSDDSRGKFDGATMGMAGRRYLGGRPGRFLRANDGVPVRWLPTLGARLKALAIQIAA
jgi:hypothetical protein